MRKLQQHVDDNFAPSLTFRKRSLTAIQSLGYRRRKGVDLHPEFRQINRQPCIGGITI